MKNMMVGWDGDIFFSVSLLCLYFLFIICHIFFLFLFYYFIWFSVLLHFYQITKPFLIYFLIQFFCLIDLSQTFFFTNICTVYLYIFYLIITNLYWKKKQKNALQYMNINDNNNCLIRFKTTKKTVRVANIPS